MINKMKNKIGFALRLFGYQVAMSIFTLMITIPVFNNRSIRLGLSVFSIILYMILVYFTAHERGEKDFVGRNNPIDPPKALDGFVYAAMAQVIPAFVIILYAIFPIVYIVMYFGAFMYSPTNFLVAVSSIGEIMELPTWQMIAWYVVAMIPEIAVGGVAYYMGFKGIFLSKIFKVDTKEVHSGPRDDDPNFDA